MVNYIVKPTKYINIYNWPKQTFYNEINFGDIYAPPDLNFTITNVNFSNKLDSVNIYADLYVISDTNDIKFYNATYMFDLKKETDNRWNLKYYINWSELTLDSKYTLLIVFNNWQQVTVHFNYKSADSYHSNLGFNIIPDFAFYEGILLENRDFKYDIISDSGHKISEFYNEHVITLLISNGLKLKYEQYSTMLADNFKFIIPNGFNNIQNNTINMLYSIIPNSIGQVFTTKFIKGFPRTITPKFNIDLGKITINPTLTLITDNFLDTENISFDIKILDIKDEFFDIENIPFDSKELDKLYSIKREDYDYIIGDGTYSYVLNYEFFETLNIKTYYIFIEYSSSNLSGFFYTKFLKSIICNFKNSLGNIYLSPDLTFDITNPKTILNIEYTITVSHNNIIDIDTTLKKDTVNGILDCSIDSVDWNKLIINTDYNVVITIANQQYKTIFKKVPAPLYIITPNFIDNLGYIADNPQLTIQISDNNNNETIKVTTNIKENGNLIETYNDTISSDGIVNCSMSNTCWNNLLNKTYVIDIIVEDLKNSKTISTIFIKKYSYIPEPVITSNNITTYVNPNFNINIKDNPALLPIVAKIIIKDKTKNLLISQYSKTLKCNSKGDGYINCSMLNSDFEKLDTTSEYTCQIELNDGYSNNIIYSYLYTFIVGRTPIYTITQKFENDLNEISTAPIFNINVQNNCGHDIQFIIASIKYLGGINKLDNSYIEKNCDGEYIVAISNLDWDKIPVGEVGSIDLIALDNTDSTLNYKFMYTNITFKKIMK